MTHRVGTKGQVVIPKSIRDRIGIQAGDRVVFDSDDEEVRIRRADRAEADTAERIRALRGLWSGEDTGTKALVAERRREREREERTAKERGLGRL